MGGSRVPPNVGMATTVIFADRADARCLPCSMARPIRQRGLARR
jgi:hypothetical protein